MSKVSKAVGGVAAVIALQVILAVTGVDFQALGVGVEFTFLVQSAVYAAFTYAGVWFAPKNADA